eukprot:84276-Amphidinium_carterae.1
MASALEHAMTVGGERQNEQVMSRSLGYAKTFNAKPSVKCCSHRYFIKHVAMVPWMHPVAGSKCTTTSASLRAKMASSSPEQTRVFGSLQLTTKALAKLQQLRKDSATGYAINDLPKYSTPTPETKPGLR